MNPTLAHLRLIFLPVFLLTFVTLAQRDDINNTYVNEIYQEGEYQFRVRFSERGDTWYKVNRSNLGNIQYKHIFSLLLTALNGHQELWIGTNDGYVFAATIRRE